MIAPPSAKDTGRKIRNVADLVVKELTVADDLAQASVLYRDVFGYTKPEATLNPRLLMAMAANGGSMVGAWDDRSRLVGFGYGFTGYAGGEAYFYSQAVTVATHLQGTGLGRRIKAEQRALALARGLHRMRWAFNPVLSRNAHFNLSVLGAVGRWFAPDCYGDGESRLVVEWDLDADGPTPRPAPWTTFDPSDWGTAARRGDRACVPVPADRTRVTPALTERLDRAFSSLMDDRFVADACLRQDDETSCYTFSREVQP